jgi:uncharacterized protein (TIGR03382 family)
VADTDPGDTKGAVEEDGGGCSTAPLAASPLLAWLALIRRRRRS